MKTTKFLHVVAPIVCAWIGANFVTSAYAQTANDAEPKLILQSISLYNPDKDGFYNGSVNVALQPAGPNGSNVSFSIQVVHVRSIDDIKALIKPTVDQLADEAKKASEQFELHQ
jgi:hypothetical protein